jgi:hypothetical protein
MSAFFDELSDLLDHLVVLDVKYVLCADFNCLGEITGPSLDDQLTEIITMYSLMQYVNEQKDGKMLDLILTLNEEQTLCHCSQWV